MFVLFESIGIATMCKHIWYVDTEVAATCTENGSCVSCCSICDKVKTEKIRKLGHDLVLTKRVESTTRTEGTEIYFCTRCEYQETKTLSLKKCKHDWLDATCTAKKTCSICGKTEGSFAAHIWDEATCTENSVCRECGKLGGVAKGHIWSEATCETPQTCSVCGNTQGGFSEHIWIEATCEKLKTCEICGTTQGELAGHTWQTTKDVGKKVCSVCGESEERFAVVQTKESTQPYLDMLGLDITEGTPAVSQEFLDNIGEVYIMGDIGSVEHGFNTYDEKKYVEIMTWKSVDTKTEENFSEFVRLLETYYGNSPVLASYPNFADEVWGWNNTSDDDTKQCITITYYDEGHIYVLWDVQLPFENKQQIVEKNNTPIQTDTPVKGSPAPTQKKSSTNKASSSTKKCEECGKAASKSVNLFGQTEYYCTTHYDEIMDIIDMMETDVGKGSASKHTCEECSKEGTRTYKSFTGQTEYYCTQHYQELMDMLKAFGLS